MKLTASFKALVAPGVICSLVAFSLAGCGGGGGSKDRNLAPASLNGKQLTFVDTDINPNVSTSYSYTTTTFQEVGGADTGAYSYSRNSTVNKANLQMVSVGAPINYELTFTSSSGGTYIDLNDGTPTAMPFTTP